MGTPKLPVVYDPRTGKIFYDLPIGDISEITNLGSSSSGSAGLPGYIEVTDDNRTFAISDQGKTILWSSSDPQKKLLLRTEAITGGAFSPGAKTTIVQTGERQVKVEADTGVTLVSDQGWASYTDSYRSHGLYSTMDLIYLGNDKWMLAGEVTEWNNPYWDITAQTGAYLFTGSTPGDHGQGIALNNNPNPSLTVQRGKEMIFKMNASGHPLWIKETQGIGVPIVQTNAAFVYNPGAAVGTQHIRFNRTGTFYYQCQYHNAMHGTITVY